MKSVLITGANSGIGLSTAEKFYKKGFKVFAHYNTSQKNLIKLSNSNFHTLQADLCNNEEINQLFARCLEMTNHKGIDVLVNNAAIYKREVSLEKIELEKFDQTINVNLRAPLILTQKAMKFMQQKKWGRNKYFIYWSKVWRINKYRFLYFIKSST